MKLKMQKNYSKDLWKKIVLMIVLIIFFVVDLVYVSFYKGVDVSSVDMEMKNEASEFVSDDSVKESSEIDEDKTISNLREFAEPLLGKNTFCLDSSLKKFCLKKQMEIETAEIFYVMIPQENEKQIYFFLKIYPSNEILQMTYDYETDSTLCESCEYTEEEIVTESWQENGPSIRDEG